MTYAFRPVATADLVLLNDWLARPHIAHWWGEGERFAAADLDDPQTDFWIVSLAGRDFAYAQSYRVHGFGPHHLDYLPGGALGIDQFIGEDDMLDRGHGSAFARQLVERLLADGSPVVGTDPHADNARAIRAYERAGFVAVGPPRDTEWGRCQLMEAWPRPATPR